MPASPGCEAGDGVVGPSAGCWTRAGRHHPGSPPIAPYGGRRTRRSHARSARATRRHSERPASHPSPGAGKRAAWHASYDTARRERTVVLCKLVFASVLSFSFERVDCSVFILYDSEGEGL